MKKTPAMILCALAFSSLNACGYYEAISGKKVENILGEPVSEWSIQPSNNDDAALRQELLDLVLKKNYGEVKAFNVVSSEWNIARNPTTSIITHRSITTSGVFKVEGEKMCRLRLSILFRQQYDGQAYGASKLAVSSDAVKVDCSKAIIPKDLNS